MKLVKGIRNEILILGAMVIICSLIIAGCSEKGTVNSHELSNANQPQNNSMTLNREIADFEKKYSDPRDFVKLKWINGIPRERAIRIITKDDMPLLHEMLKDLDYAPYWHNVANLIGYISDDPCSVPVLLDYFQRNDETMTYVSFPAKIWCVANIGRIGKQGANELLHKAITEEGAIELAQEWLDSTSLEEEYSREWTIDYIRLAAMHGLIYTGIKENIELIENIYEKENAVYKDTGEVTRLLHNSIDALAARDYIAENGISAYMNLASGDISRFSSAMEPYFSRYAPFLNIKAGK